MGYVVDGGSGGGSIVAADITDSTATGRDVLTGTAAEGTLALGVRSTVDDPLTGTGWTTLPASNGQTVTWTAGTSLELLSPAGVNAGGECGVHKSTTLIDGENYEFLVRLDVVSDGGSPGSANLALSCGVDANNRVYWQLFTDGSFQGGGFSGGSWVSLLNRTSVEVTSGQMTGGDLWLRISARLGAVALWWGVGTAGALPTTWTRRSTTQSATLFSQLFRGLRLGVEVDTNSAPSSNVVINVLDIRTVEQLVSLT